MLRQIIIAAVAVLILVLSFVVARGLSKRPETQKKAETAAILKKVRAITVENQEIQTEVQLYGRLVPFEKTELFSEVGGRLLATSKPFRVGTRFAKGELLIKVDKKEAELSLRAQRAQLLSVITSMLPDIKIDFSESLEQWENYRSQLKPEALIADLPEPKSEREKDFLALKDIYNLYYSIKSAEERLTKYELRAPFSGELTEALINTGSLIRAGQRIGSLMNINAYELQASVPLVDLKYISLGDKVQLQSEDVEGEWSGSISRISSTIDAASQTVAIFIRVSGPNLKENMFLTGEVSANRLANVMEIPRKLLRGDTAVFVIQEGKEKSLALQSIQAVKISEQTALVRGLENGQALLAEPFPAAYEGMKVELAN
ncbi:HlyD family efflux transporter periplasmic adaptor subunit [Saprospira sp. CCB-QB6]|uniref:efflux RND transporter periplasmic adaptor subunit n=1 Tax=Saprospira sp. CCB-QB6 TaxID=3023936 RepID=UPI0023491757|nr:HlyD family efflux transporter periplasmic adaptor subunit [Saprospira sp. CCB-QB6]WCL81730.1 HlyD family efflux transporter periplasmic adaptor subunit [Saprospira sp. CCB-QB6]